MVVWCPVFPYYCIPCPHYLHLTFIFFACPLFLSVFCCVISPHCVNTAKSFTLSSVQISISTPFFSVAFLLPVPRTFCFLIWVFCLLANKVFLCQYLDASTSCVLVLFSDTTDKYHYWWAFFLNLVGAGSTYFFCLNLTEFESCTLWSVTGLVCCYRQIWFMSGSVPLWLVIVSMRLFM